MCRVEIKRCVEGIRRYNKIFAKFSEFKETEVVFSLGFEALQQRTSILKREILQVFRPLNLKDVNKICIFMLYLLKFERTYIYLIYNCCIQENKVGFIFTNREIKTWLFIP